MDMMELEIIAAERCHDGLVAIEQELIRARARFAPLSSSHEAYAVIAEEVDEFWDAVKANNERAALAEVVQIAATALRFLVERPPMDKRNGAS